MLIKGLEMRRISWIIPWAPYNYKGPWKWKRQKRSEWCHVRTLPIIASFGAGGGGHQPGNVGGFWKLAKAKKQMISGSSQTAWRQCCSLLGFSPVRPSLDSSPTELPDNKSVFFEATKCTGTCYDSIGKPRQVSSSLTWAGGRPEGYINPVSILLVVLSVLTGQDIFLHSLTVTLGTYHFFPILFHRTLSQVSSQGSTWFLLELN